MTTHRTRRAASAATFCLAAVMGAALLTSVRPGAAQEPKRDAAQERFDLKVRTDFFAGFAGDQKRLERGMKACEEMLAKDPKHGEALVWHGTGLLMQARAFFEKGEQQKGIPLWIRSLKEMDDAVRYEPDNPGVRIPRGAVLMTASRFVPDEKQKTALLERATSDFERVYELQKNSLGRLGTHPRGELLMALAEGARRQGKEDRARAYLEQVKATCKDSDYDKRATEWLGDRTLMAHTCIGCHTPAEE
jgi:tetratricopeptide (TPR) repeat protein